MGTWRLVEIRSARAVANHILRVSFRPSKKSASALSTAARNFAEAFEIAADPACPVAKVGSIRARERRGAAGSQGGQRNRSKIRRQHGCLVVCDRRS
jgi:hypothetical protein